MADAGLVVSRFVEAQAALGKELKKRGRRGYLALMQGQEHHNFN